MSAPPSRPNEVASVLERLGVKPVINACGTYSELGGSRLSPGVWAAMEEVNRHFVRVADLVEQAGQYIAGLLKVESALITPGASAGIMLATAASMAGTDGAKSEQLPDATGMKSEVLIQGGHRYMYDRQVTLAGAKLIQVGTSDGVDAEQFEAAISDRTAMVLHPAHLDRRPGALKLEVVSAICRSHGVPVLVDGAFMSYPPEAIANLLHRGGDLVCVSSKYFGGPNSGGFIVGRADLMAAVSNVHFTRYESSQYLKFGRPLKMDRQTIVAVVVAFEEWIHADPSVRFARFRRQVEMLRKDLEGIPGLKLTPMCFTKEETFEPEPVNCLAIDFNSSGPGMSAAEVAAALEAGSPPILAIRNGTRLAFAMTVLEDAEVSIIGKRLRELLA